MTPGSPVKVERCAGEPLALLRVPAQPSLSLTQFPKPRISLENQPLTRFGLTIVPSTVGSPYAFTILCVPTDTPTLTTVHRRKLLSLKHLPTVFALLGPLSKNLAHAMR